MARKKVALQGAGQQWFPLLRHFVGTKNNRGSFFDMAPGPELRLYIVLSLESHDVGSRSFVRTNEHLREFTGLDRNYLPRARKGLIERGLIHAERASKQSYRYELLGRGGGLRCVDRPEDNPTFFDVPDSAETANAA